MNFTHVLAVNERFRECRAVRSDCDMKSFENVGARLLSKQPSNIKCQHLCESTESGEMNRCESAGTGSRLYSCIMLSVWPHPKWQCCVPGATPRSSCAPNRRSSSTSSGASFPFHRGREREREECSAYATDTDSDTVEIDRTLSAAELRWHITM